MVALVEQPIHEACYNKPVLNIYIWILLQEEEAVPLVYNHIHPREDKIVSFPTSNPNIIIQIRKL